MTRNSQNEPLTDRMQSQAPAPQGQRGNARTNWAFRAVVEVAFIVFLFYANLLMGEFTGTRGAGKSLLFAIGDIFTGTNLLIAIVSALIGYVGFEWLRKRL